MSNLQKYSRLIPVTRKILTFPTSDNFEALASNNERVGISRNISEQAFYLGELDLDNSFEVLKKFVENREYLSNAIARKWSYNPFKTKIWLERNQVMARLAARRFTEEEYFSHLNELKLL